MKNILIVEDSEAIVKGLKYLLEQEGYNVDASECVNDTFEIIKTKKYDLVLIDITLPDGDGFEVCEFVKRYTDISVIFLTAKDEEKSVVKGLDMGAEDYIVKPFRNKELISRINNVFRRCGNENELLEYGKIKIDLNKMIVYVDNKDLEFTPIEYKLLLLLINNSGKVVTRKEILEKIWDVNGNFVNDNTLTVCIKRIRAKLGNADEIKTIKGIGYMI